MLGHPLPNAPDDQMLLQRLIDQLGHHTVQLAATPAHWSIESCLIPAGNDVEDYVVTGAGFGRPFLVHTEDRSEPNHPRREIPFTLMQNADRLYSGGQKATGGGTKHTAAEIIFYRRGTVTSPWWARLVPIPATSGDYKVWYDTVYEFGALSDSPGLQFFHHLVRTQTALSVLPFCAWQDAAPEKNAQVWQLRYSAIRDSLLHDEAIYQKQFNEYRSQQTREGVSSKLPYGWSEEQGGFGIGGMVSGWGY